VVNEKYQPDQPQEESNLRKSSEIAKLVVIIIVWISLFILSFFTYFSIPFLIFVTWFIIAAFIKLLKKDEDHGSGYDKEV